MNKLLNGKKIVILFSVLFSVLLLLNVFVLQFGIQDNGSLFERLNQLGIYDAQGASGSGHYATMFGIANGGYGFSTADLPFRLLGLFLPVNTPVSIAITAGFYTLLMILGACMLFKSMQSKYTWNNVLLGVLLIFVFCDAAYTAFLNTPYKNAAMLSYLLFMAGAVLNAVRNKKSTWRILLAAISAVLFAGISETTAIIGILLALYFVRLCFFKYGNLQKIICGIACACLLATSVCVFSFNEPSEQQLFNSVFYGVALQNEKNAETGFSEPVANPQGAITLGFDEQTATELSGKAYFEEEAQQYIAEHNLQETVSYGKIASYYVKHPSAFSERLQSVGLNSNLIGVSQGEYREITTPAGKYLPGGLYSLCTMYSNFKYKLFPAKWIMIFILWILMAAVTVFYRKKYAENEGSKATCDLMLLGVAAMAVAFVMPFILNGLASVTFMMNFYNMLFDICLVACIVGGTKLLWKRREALKEKFGVNQ